jgi:DNA-binding GntR family transcriptional regulator
VRRSLERLLVDRACAQASEQERRDMMRLADLTEAAAQEHDFKAFLAVNREVQDLKAKSAHNEILRSTMDLFFGLSRRFWVAYSPRVPNSLETASRLHARALRSIAVADRDGAIKATDELLDFLEGFTRQTIETRLAV